ncbi:Copia protein [Cyphomyrmex costatus]|uniref:Copia protein n=1 Tax=Cyphomyrmex costatus TaxID=456900 RepID=A0A151K360_9HYME|nr:Copia protein [Cyphomyrmex costatus]
MKRDGWDITCHYCHKRRHIERRCYKKRDDMRNKKEANSSTKENDSENFDAFVISKCEPASRILTSDPNEIWILDSGASKHMCFRREWFNDLDENYRESVSLGDNSMCEVKAHGTINIKMYVDGRWFDDRLDVLFIPSLRRNFFSTGICTSKGYILNFERDNVNGSGKVNNLFRLLIKVNEVDEVNAASVNSLQTWHERLGHINCRSLCKMTKENIVNGGFHYLIMINFSAKIVCLENSIVCLLNLKDRSVVIGK